MTGEELATLIDKIARIPTRCFRIAADDEKVYVEYNRVLDAIKEYYNDNRIKN